MDLLKSGRILPPEVLLRAVEDAVRAAWFDGFRTGLIVGILVAAFAALVLVKLGEKKQ